MNEFDNEKKRATFGLRYPLEDLFFERKDKYDFFQQKTTLLNQNDLKRFVKAKRVSFNLNNAVFSNIIFEECNFHNMKGLDVAKINKLSFENCDFKKNIMSTAVYHRVTFKNCTFEKCGFMYADFKECIFENCTFNKCTAYQTRFIKSQIHPKSFLDSIEIPYYNFDSISTDKQIEIEREWVQIKLFLARQIFNSNNSITNSVLSDESLHELKKQELKFKKDKLKYGDSEKNIKAIKCVEKFRNKKMDILNYRFASLNLRLTNGGTSLSKLNGISILFILFISFILSIVEIKHHGISLKYISTDTTSYYDFLLSFLSNIPFSISLFLGFGYSSFSSSNAFSNYFLVSTTLIGLVWYALTISIIIRKIYR